MKKIFRILLFLFLPLITILPLLRVEYFPMHDRQHIVRLFLLDTAIKQGNFFPRWVDGLGFGYGYALFNFYPPLIYYLAEFFRLLGFGYVVSIKLMLISGFYLSFIGMYLLVKKLFKDGKAGFLAATLYLYAPYHAVLTYVRGAFAELLAYNLLPLVFLGFYNLTETGNYLMFSFFFALLILAHPLVAFSFILVFAFFFLVFWLFHKGKAKLLITTIKGGLLGLGLSGFFWLPSMWERKYTLVNQILTTQLANYNLHFVYLRQLWESPWGFGGSIYGLWDGMSFQIGKLHILLLVGFLLSLALAFLNKKQRLFIYKYLPLVAIVFFAIFMTSFHSKPIWDWLKLLWYLQFPWRFLVFVSFAVSITGVIIITQLKQNLKTILVTFLVIFSLIYYGKLFNPQRYVTGADKAYISENEVKWEQSRSSFEFMYKDVKTIIKPDNTTTLAIDKKEVPKTMFKKNAKVTVLNKKNTFKSKQAQVIIEEKTNLVFNTSYFPGWQIYVNNQPVKLELFGKLRLLQVSLDKGQYFVEARFVNTKVRNIAWLITLFSVLFALWFRKKTIFLGKQKGKH